MSEEARIRQRSLHPSSDPFRRNPHRAMLSVWRDMDRGWRFDGMWQQVAILQHEYHHEMATFTARWPKDDLRTFRRRMPVGAPVRLDWGRRNGGSTFHGYVHHRRFYPVDDTYADATVYCLGASVRTRNVRGKVWTGYRFDEVAREVARHSRFNYSVERIKSRQRSITQQADEQPWAFLTRYAVQHNMTTYFHSPDLRLVIQPRTISHLSQYRPPRVFEERDSQSDILGFSDREGSALPGEVLSARRAAIAMDPKSGRILTMEGSQHTNPDAHAEYPAMSTRVLTGLSPNGLGELRDSLHAHEERANAHVVHATVRLRGDVRVTPASVVYLSGVNKRDDGYWLVTKTHHVLTPDTYETEIRVERNEQQGRVLPPPTLEWFKVPYLPDADAPRFTQADRRREPVILWHGRREVRADDRILMTDLAASDAVPDVRDRSDEEKRVRRRRATERPLLHGEWRARVSVGVGVEED